jgi:SNF2 family DNA or RNA helicase
MSSSLKLSNVKNLNDQCSSLVSQVKSATSSDKINEYSTNIKKSSDEMVLQEKDRILKSISVETLASEKKGYNIKALSEAFSSLYNLREASVGAIAAVNGIGDKTAKMIDFDADIYAKRVQEEVKIRLSSDEQNIFSDRLVMDIYAFKESQGVLEELKALASETPVLEQKKLSLKPALSPFKWLFTSKAVKAQVSEAFDYLSDKVYGKYHSDIVDRKHLLESIKQVEPSVAWKDFEKNTVSYFSILEKINPGVLGSQDDKLGLPEEIIKRISEEQIATAQLKCTLRTYQEWGVKYILHQGKVLLGDEMGLGKTIQAIATMVTLRNQGASHFVVVCPASVMLNWVREVGKFSDLFVTEVHGGDRDDELTNWLYKGGVAVTTYETMGKLVLPDSMRISMLVVDEVHYIKNPDALRTKNVSKLIPSSDRVLFMTGTALENNVQEMVNIITMLQPQMALKIKPLAFMATAKLFKEKIAEVYYRRRREDVLTELPELEEISEWCKLLPEEKSVYRSTVMSSKKNFSLIRRVSWNTTDIENSSKAIRLLELVEEAKSEGRKVLIFSFFLDTISSVASIVQSHGGNVLPIINGSVAPNTRQEIIDNFEKAPAGSVLPAQVIAGGTGLNIQAASVVILCEPQLKPSTENQAISRAYRMGQSRKVLVYRLLCEKTVDEKIMDMLQKKQEIFDKFADESVAASNEIKDSELESLINEESKRLALEGENDATTTSSTEPTSVNP